MQEIERKFVLHEDLFQLIPHHARESKVIIRQGYLSTDPDLSVRIRLTDPWSIACLTAKSPACGLTREETECYIEYTDGVKLYRLAKHVILKHRYRFEVNDLDWEIDVYADDNTGLVIAEVEMDAEHQYVDLPHWSMTEVTDDPKYSNMNLAQNPYLNWNSA